MVQNLENKTLGKIRSNDEHVGVSISIPRSPPQSVAPKGKELSLSKKIEQPLSRRENSLTVASSEKLY